MGLFDSWNGWRAYRKLDTSWKRIVFYSESGQDWHYFEPLIERLNADHAERVTYVTSDRDDPGLYREHPLYRAVCIPQGLFLIVHFQVQQAVLVVLTMMDLDKLQLKKSLHPVHYVYLFHSMGSTHMVDHANSYDAYNTLFCVGPHHVAELRRREALAGLPPRQLFEYGHPRLEALIDSAPEPRDAPPGSNPCLLLAPTWGEQSTLNTCGYELVRCLLDHGYRLILRPHYQTRKQSPEVIDRLLEAFSDHPRFEYIAAMGESTSLHRSDLLICDWSAMAIEYALGLGKPVLFVDVPRRVRNPDWQDWGLEPLEASIRDQVGDILDPQRLNEAPAKIDALLSGTPAFRESLMEIRQRMVFNLGASVTLGATELSRLARQHETGTRDRHASN